MYFIRPRRVDSDRNLTVEWLAVLSMVTTEASALSTVTLAAGI